MKNIRISTIAAAILSAAFLTLLIMYRSLSGDYDLLSSQFAEQVAINKDYKSRIQSLHELDTMYTQELTNVHAGVNQCQN